MKETRRLLYRQTPTARLFVTVAALALLALLLAPPAYPQATGYEFTKVADSAEDGFDPSSFGCTTINNQGDVAFRAGRVAPDGFNTIPGIYRVNANGTLTTIAENGKQFQFIGFNPSMNDLGQVSFAASLNTRDKQTGDNIENILRGDGKKLTTIASTADGFNFFGFDTSVNNSGEVAFKAERDEEFGFDEGLFSGSGNKKLGVTTHYLNSADVTLDGDPARFDGSDSRPSINNPGDIALNESIDFANGVFRGQEGQFTTIAAPDTTGNTGVREPTLNDSGTAAFVRSFSDPATGEFVEEIVTGNGGPPTTAADTRGEFRSFGFRPPSLNNGGDVAFLADLDSGGSGIFTGLDPVADRVVGTGDALDGDVVQNLSFCEEGLNDTGELAFRADFLDPETFESRSAVFRATPLP